MVGSGHWAGPDCAKPLGPDVPCTHRSLIAGAHPTIACSRLPPDSCADFDRQDLTHPTEIEEVVGSVAFQDRPQTWRIVRGSCCKTARAVSHAEMDAAFLIAKVSPLKLGYSHLFDKCSDGRQPHVRAFHYAYRRLVRHPLFFARKTRSNLPPFRPVEPSGENTEVAVVANHGSGRIVVTQVREFMSEQARKRIGIYL